MKAATKCCADCGTGMKYGTYVLPFGSKRTGFYCLPCGTVTERFGTLDVTVAA